MRTKKNATDDSFTKKELLDIMDDYSELTQLLHNEMDNIPKNVQDKIWDKVYKRFEP